MYEAVKYRLIFGVNESVDNTPYVVTVQHYNTDTLVSLSTF